MKKILAIDDQQDNLTTIKAVIKSYMPDCKVITALSGNEGLKIAKEEKPDTILLDIIMPRMDGYEVCRRIKENELIKNIPVLMLTATKTDIQNKVKGLEIGADAFLTKPIDPVELTAQLNVMLRIKGAEDKLRTDKMDLETIVLDRTKELREINEKLKLEIAERKQAEEESKKSEEKYRELVETSVDGVISIDSQMKVCVWNKGAENIFGYTREEIMGQSIMKIVPDRYRKKMETGFDKFQKGGLGPVIGKTLELKILRKDGKEIPVELSVSSRKLDETYIATAIARDITERKQAEEELKKHRENLEELVNERTKELNDNIKELERLNKLFIDREFRIKELRDEIKKLKNKNNDR
ncbi:MAG: PAS domain S-box protein [Bacteroidales bacterium]|nr:PAS domain S-box protein [Bacteroidales bacterium]